MCKFLFPEIVRVWGLDYIPGKTDRGFWLEGLSYSAEEKGQILNVALSVGWDCWSKQLQCIHREEQSFSKQVQFWLTWAPPHLNIFPHFLCGN
jgi:hypothetical protein